MKKVFITSFIVIRRIGKAHGVFARLTSIWKSSAITLSRKVQMLQTCVFSVLLYASETWTLRKEDERRLRAFEMRCYRSILNIRWFHRVANEEMRHRIRTNSDIVQTVKRRKLGLFGHICRMVSQRLIKDVLIGVVEGNNRRGRPKNSWIDDIKEWTNLSLPKLYRSAQSRREWRAIVNSS